MSDLSFFDVEKAYHRIKNYVKNTKIVTNQDINSQLNNQLFFKCDNFQQTGSFKSRGAFNAILSYKEKNGCLPKKIVAVSSGNHAQAIAFVCSRLNIEALIYMAKNTSNYKIEATRSYGAELVICDKRSEANKLAQNKIKEGYFFIHPSANEDVILGQATACYEALKEMGEVDLISVPVGGGGLASGSFLAKNGLSPQAKIIGCEPEIANDVAISVRENKIFSFSESPKTIADGARTLSVLEPCFSYLKIIDEIVEVSEEKIKFWQDEFLKYVEMKIEPTSSLAIAGVEKYIEKHKIKNQKILVIISGGNL